MSVSRPRVVIFGSAEEPPPGISRAERLSELGYASSSEDLQTALVGTHALFAWDYDDELLP